jgi:NADPH:quinone reductase-like Zn-dependent oxidoreductase
MKIDTDGMNEDCASMLALRIVDWNEAPRLERIARPIAAEGETLIKIEAATVSHLDLTVMTGKFDIQPKLPYVGGTDGAGFVVESGRFTPGTLVALRGGGIGLTRDGTWAEYVAVPDSALREVPQSLSPELAATVYSPLTTSYVALQDIGQMGRWSTGPRNASEEVVIVTGASGAVGSVVVQMAGQAGAHVIAVVSSDARRSGVAGAAETVALSDKDKIAEIAAARAATLLVDTVGGPQLRERIGWVRPGGRAVLLGYTAGKELTMDIPNWLFASVALLPVSMFFHEARARELIGSLTELVQNGTLRLNVESHPLRQSSAAFERLQQGAARGKVVLRP